jgi:hypothetical protein
MHIHDVGIAVEIHVPNLLGDKCPRQNVTRSPGEEGQQGELLWGQVKPLPSPHCPVAHDIYFEVGHLDRL